VPKWILLIEYCEGGSLEHRLRKDGAPGLVLNLVRRYSAEVLTALEYLHSNQVIHRDVKLANIVLTARDHCKLTDFGLVSETDMGKSLLGTPGYMAPEVCRGSLSGFSAAEGESLSGVDIHKEEYYGCAVDLYSWGASVCALLGEDMLNSSFSWDNLCPSDLPEDVINLIKVAMHENPESRGSAKELRCHSFFREVDWDLLIEHCKPDRDLREIRS
jgi:serine/threonine protein kinase